MTDVNTNLELDRTTIAAASHQCVELFATCLAQASAIHPREFSRVEDQAARFSTWTSGIGVFAPGRASMDHRIRYAPEVQSVAIGLLDSLNHRIQKCSDIMGDPGKGSELDVLTLTQALERAYGDIASEISHLNKMSNVIRRASRESQAMKIKSFKDKDEDTAVERMLFDIYKRYISERFPIASNIIQQRLAEAMIFRRKRILYWRYRQRGTTIKLPIPSFNISITLPEPQKPASSAQADLPQEDKQETTAVDPVVVSSEIQSATTLQPEISKSAATSPSVSSSVTIALSGHETLDFPTAPGANVKRRYEQLRAERLAAHKTVLDKLDKAYPDNDSRRNLRFDKQNSRAIAEEDLKRNLEADIRALGEITCPYCLEALPAIEVFDDRKWRKHVRNDLDPYVCLFEECNEADELYKHSEKWIIHMRQHNRLWRCPSHRELDPFLTRELYMQHMREAHNFKLGEKKLLILASRNARKATKLFASCPLCGKSEAEVDCSLEGHVTGHLRSLALTSLPPYQEDLEANVGSGRDSCDDSQRRSVRAADDLSATKGSLTDEVNNELSKLSEIEDTDFVNEAPFDLDPTHTDMWNSWVNDWIINKPTLRQLQQTSYKDPIFQLMREKAKEIHSLSQTLQQQQQPNQPLPYERTPFPPESADQNPPCNTLYVGNLPIDADEKELKAMFAKQQGYKRLSFRTKDNGPRCFVEFEDASSATRAMHELYGIELHNSTEGGIRLGFSKSPLGVRSVQSPWHASQGNVPSNDGKEAAGMAKVEYNYPLVNLGHIADTGGKGSKREQQNQQVLGPYTFTHYQLEREGVIQKSNISDGRRHQIYFKFTSPSPGTFVISLHMEGRIRALLELNLQIDDLLKMQKDNEDELDLEYVQFNVSKLLIFLPKTFVWGPYDTPFSGRDYGWLWGEHFRPPVTLETDILDPFSPANMIVEDT